MQGLAKLYALLKKCGRKALKTPKNVSQDYKATPSKLKSSLRPFDVTTISLEN